MKKCVKKPVSVLLALTLAAISPAAVYAGPGSTDEENAAAAASKARLEDNTLEFDEISDRIENYNVTYNNTKTTIVNASLHLDASRSLAEDASDLMDEALEFKDDDDRQLYEEYKAMSRALRKESEKLMNDELSKGQQKTLAHIRKNLTKVTEDLVIQYASTKTNLDTVKKSVETSEAALDLEKNMAAQGLASEAAVLSAEQSLLSARQNEQQLESGLTALKSNIRILCGYPSDADITIADIGDIDLSRIDRMNPETDKTAAVQANFNLESTKETSVTGRANHREKQRTVATSEQTIASKLEQLYAGVLSDREAYEAAQTKLQAAENDRASAERKNRLGMMSRVQYLSAELSYLNSRASAEQAKLTLFKAMQDYDWAVGGLISSGQSS